MTGPERLIDASRLRAFAANGSYYTALEQLERERSQRQIAAFGETLNFSDQLCGAAVVSGTSDAIDLDDPFN